MDVKDLQIEMVVELESVDRPLREIGELQLDFFGVHF